MIRMRSAACITAVIVVLLGSASGTPHAQQPRSVVTPPKLVVFITVDQMRADYVDKFLGQWSRGLKRLVTQGAWFRQAQYPYAFTVTCAGHASLSTGTVPAIHGLNANGWLDRRTGKLPTCTEDETTQLISYGGPVHGPGQSAARLQVPTFVDELRAQRHPQPQIVSMSLKARAAVTLAGRRADVVLWLDEPTGQWATSTAYTSKPVPFIATYINGHPLSAEIGKRWDRALPKDRYFYDDSPLGRRSPSIGALNFPHTVAGHTDEPGEGFAAAWESSPFSDEYLAALATLSLDELRLGRGAGTDYLAIGFSALDKVGHDFGPDSHEVQDVLIRLDRVLGTLFDKLDRDLGAGTYTVALSADHGVAPVPERISAMGFDAGRFEMSKIAAAVNQAVAARLGPGKYVAGYANSDIYFETGVYEKVAADAELMTSVLGLISQTPGIWKVYTKDTLEGALYDADPVLRAAARSYFKGRSGDLTVLARPYWLASTNTTNHGSVHAYDTHVPVLLYGHGIRPGEYLEPASPIDLAPTLAFLTSVTLPGPTGRVLTEAIAPALPRPKDDGRQPGAIGR